jgi:hypothetical protein
MFAVPARLTDVLCVDRQRAAGQTVQVTLEASDVAAVEVSMAGF